MIDRFAERVVFADGWHLSVGCCLEYFYAYELRLPCLDSGLDALNPCRAKALISEGCEELSKVGVDSTLLIAKLQKVRECSLHSKYDLAGLTES